MPATLYCPACGQRLTVSDAAPQHVTCPKCLAQVLNPGGRDPHARVTPIPAIPVEAEAAGDQRKSTIALSVLVCLLVAGPVILLVYGRGGALPLLLIGAAIAFVFARDVRSRWSGDATPPTLRNEPLDHAPPGDPKILGYARPRRYMPQEGTGGASAVPGFAFGFFAAMGVCAAGFLTLGFTAEGVPQWSHGPILLAVVALVAAYLASVPFTARRVNGYTPGAIVGMVLGLMALGPCAFCYLMTLG